MNEYQPALNQLRAQRKGKPGELWLLCGITLAIVSPFTLALANEDGRRLAALKTDGRVAEATVVDKAVQAEIYTDSKGRQRTRDLHLLGLRHDINAELPYADWRAGTPFLESQYPALTITSIEVGVSYYDSLALGDMTTVVRNPAFHDSMMLTDQLEYETSFAHMLLWYLGAAVAVLAGFGMAIHGWRQRFARG